MDIRKGDIKWEDREMVAADRNRWRAFAAQCPHWTGGTKSK